MKRSAAYRAPDLRGKIALVAGGTRGAGRGIAIALGEAGATVYCTGRSSRKNPRGMSATPGRPETIEETAELVTAAGGRGISVKVDHTETTEVKKLVAAIKRRHHGLDILVNDVWGGDALTEFGKPFWKLKLDDGLRMLKQAIHSHIITSHYAVPLMLGREGGIIFEITDGDAFYYRGNLFYDLAKISVIRLAFAMRCWNTLVSARLTGGTSARRPRSQSRTVEIRTTRPTISWCQNRHGTSAGRWSRWRQIQRSKARVGESSAPGH